MSSITRTVRFQKSEAQQIEQFLKKNPVLDFSTLARLAITRFIRNPNLQLHPVDSKSRSKRNSQATAEEI